MGRKRLSGVSKTYHIRVTSSTERDLYDFLETQMSQGKSFKDVVVLLFNFFQSNGVKSGGVAVAGGSVVDVQQLTERVLRELEERMGSGLEVRFDSNFRVMGGPES